MSKYIQNVKNLHYLLQATKPFGQSGKLFYVQNVTYSHKSVTVYCTQYSILQTPLVTPVNVSRTQKLLIPFPIVMRRI